jgi:hypothetical protein
MNDEMKPICLRCSEGEVARAIILKQLIAETAKKKSLWRAAIELHGKEPRLESLYKSFLLEE